MKTMTNEYLITAYVENQVGMLNRVLNVFSRRMINIESLTVVETKRKGISKVTLVIESDKETVMRLVKFIKKQVGVWDAFMQSNDQITLSKVSLYKMFTQSLANHDENVLAAEQRYVS